ncbi:MAG: tyrosine-protein kinase family protein [Clostridia bacterium]|nr:tyrosine-protein kinase family protein [Clostridia bacterium]
MDFKRITIISGHFGSGKTNIAVNLALELAKKQSKVAILDIDIVNPYFRTKDSTQLLNDNGVRLICSKYANSNVDIPALPQEIYSVTDDLNSSFIIDVGGDDRGALALGRLAPKIKEENNYDMYYVVNKFRPLTSDSKSTIEVMREIEFACKMKFTGIINNSNLGLETTEQDVLSSVEYANEIAKEANLKVVLTTVESSLYNGLKNKIDNLYSLTLQKKL